MANLIRFVDSVNFEPQVSEAVKDFYANPANTMTSLKIRIAATHSGKITRNNGFYLPHRMKAGAGSFTSQYPKPIQVHHDSQKDPVGRVIASRYVDTSHGIMDAWDGRKIKDELRPISDNLLQMFCDGKLSRREMLEIADRYFIQDNNIVDDPDYQGLGYVELIAEINDPEAIQKVMDKRYLTGSVGATTDSATCSVCKKDWAGDEGPCEHKPGKVYDSKKCVLIAGDLKYDEWSFVNAPADSHSSVIELNTAGIQDSVKQADNTLPSQTVAFEILDCNNGGNTMAEQVKDVHVTSLTVKTEEEHGHSHEAYLDEDGDGSTNFVAHKHPDAKEDEPPVEHRHTVQKWDVKEERGHGHKIQNPLKKKKDEAVTEEPKVEEPAVVADPPKAEDQAVVEPASVVEPAPVAAPTVEDAIKAHFGELYDEFVGDDAWGKEYAEMVMLIEKGELLDEDGSKIDLTDKKLKAADRKKMSGSTFCGPGRSYPVNDCGHAKSAMAYAKKYNAGGSVQACIRRKASRLGCPFTSDAAKKDAVEPQQYDIGLWDTSSDEELVAIYTTVKQALKERNLTCPCENHEESGKQQERIDSMQKEMKLQLEDIDNLHNQLADVYKATRQMKVENIYNFKRLAGETVEFIKLSDELKDTSSEDMDKILKDLGQKVDIDKITDKINSGLSNDPQGIVDNPVITEKVETEKRDLNRATLEGIRANYIALALQRGQIVADNYLVDLQKRGILPSGKVEELKKS